MEHSLRPTLRIALPEETKPLNHGSAVVVQGSTPSPQHSQFGHPAVSKPNHSRSRRHHKGKRAKFRDELLHPKMNTIASSSTSSAFRAKGNDDDGLLRPITREATRSRWGSESTGLGTRSRSSSLFNGMEKSKQPVLIKPQEIRSMEDLQQFKDQRSQGEEYLRSALSLIGTLATDITRRLDYTYYGLLEKIAALNTTITSFQDLSDSGSKLYNDFQRETSALEQDIRKQISDLREFKPQMQKIDALEERMRVSKTRAGALSSRLDAMRNEIERWERREVESQKRINQRLRIFWSIITAGVCVVMIALAIRNRPAGGDLGTAIPSQAAVLSNPFSHILPGERDDTSISGSQRDKYTWPPDLPTRAAAGSASTGVGMSERPRDYDRLGFFDEL